MENEACIEGELQRWRQRIFIYHQQLPVLIVLPLHTINQCYTGAFFNRREIEDKMIVGNSKIMHIALWCRNHFVLQ